MTMTLFIGFFSFFGVFSFIAAAFVEADGHTALLLEQRFAALRAVFAGGLIPAHEIAFWPVGAAVEGIALLRFALNDLGAALGAQSVCLKDEGLRVLAFGIAGAGEKTTVTPGLDDHHASALLTRDIGDILLKLNFYILHLGLCFVE